MTNILAVFIVTAYCHCASCNGKAGQPTASGLHPKQGITIAAPQWLKFGTRLRIEGFTNEFIVQDRMHKRYRRGRYIDIFMNSHAAAKKFGRRELKVAKI